MNTKLLIGAVAVIVIAAGAWAFISRNEPGSGPSGSEQAFVMMDKKPGSLKEFIQVFSEQECTFSQNSGAAESSGVVYLGKNTMRGDFVTTSGTEKMDAHMIVEGDDVYIWMDGQSQGFQTTVDASATVKKDSQPGLDFENDVDLDCKRWKIDASKFNRPSNIEFLNVEAMMEEKFGAGANVTGNTAVDIKAQQCAACDAAGSAKEQCRIALGC